MPFRIIIAVLLILLPGFCRSFPGGEIKGLYDEWRWVRFGTESGLPSERVIRVLETPGGEVWAQTSRGLAWFDGFRWHQARVPGMSESDQAVYSFRADSVGIAVFQRGVLFHVDRDTVRRIAPQIHGRTIGVHQAWYLNSEHFFQSDSSLFRESAGTVRVFPSPYDRFDSVEYHPRYVNNHLMIAGGTMYLKLGGSLYRFDGNSWTSVFNSRSGFLRVTQLEENEAGSGAAVMESSIGRMDVCFWEPGTRPRPYPGEEGDLVLSVAVSPTNETLLLLSSENLRMHRKGTIQTLPAFPAPVNHPLSIRFRRNGDLWVCTERGLFLCRLTSQRWSTWDTGGSGRANIVNSMISARDGSFWVGTRDGLYVRSANGKSKLIRTIGTQLLGRITAIAEDREGNIWIGSGASFPGSFRWDGRAWRHFGEAEGLSAPRVHKIVLTASGQLWFLGMAEGSVAGNLSDEPGAFLYAEGRFHRMGRTEGLLDGRVYSMVEDRSGALWFGTLTGLSRYSKGSWRYWKSRSELVTGQVFALAADSSNRIWIGQKWNGLGCIDSTGSVAYYTVDDGLVSNLVWDLVVDADGHLWIGTMEGIGCFDGRSWYNFDIHTGLTNSRIWPLLLKDRRVYAGTQGNGVSVLSIDELTAVPPITILESSIAEDDRVTLSWSVNAYWADIPPHQIDTRYRLEGQSWSAWSPTRSVVFTGLHAGTHRFEVELRRTSWQGATQLSTATFSMPPPLYLRPLVALPIAFLALLVLTLWVVVWERKRRYHRAISESEVRFRAQYKSNPVPTFTWKLTGDQFLLVEINDAALALTRGRVASWVGRPLQELLKHRPDAVKTIEQCFADQSVIHQEMNYNFVTEDRSADLAVTYSYVHPDMVLTHLEDITQRKRSEARIRESRELLRALANRLESIREEERTHLSREIHDELGQLMTGLKMDLAWIRKRVFESGQQSVGVMLDRIQQMNALLDESIQTVRKIAGQLRPALLDELGLIAAIEWQANDWQKRTAIKCRIDLLSDEQHFSSETATELFRIFQELLTNIARHAGATEVSVVLDRIGSETYLEVHDNGRGIREDEINRPVALGILGMEERAARIGGQIAFHGESGKGTTVRVTIPTRQVAL